MLCGSGSQTQKTAYIDAKRVAKHAIWLAMSEAEKEEFAPVSPVGDGVFHFAKSMDHRNQDIVGENCVCNDACAHRRKTRWRYGLSTMLGCSMLNLCGQVTSSLRSLQLLAPLPVYPRPRSANHLATWNAARLLAHPPSVGQQLTQGIKRKLTPCAFNGTRDAGATPPAQLF